MYTRCVSDVEYMIPGVDSTCGESFPQTLWAILVFFGIFEFFKKFLLNPDIELYFKERNNKYLQRDNIIPGLPNYFKEWLAGFIESEGCFSHRVQGNYSFSIAQNHDYYLIEAIRNFYGLNHLKIFNKKGKFSQSPFYEFSVGSVAGTEKVIDHCTNLIQGYKYYQLAVFILKSKVFQDQVKELFLPLKAQF